MLELRPCCEQCATQLPPASTEARICSYECTYCADCVATVLFNVCPNCGGGFTPRPIRPAVDRRKGNYLGNDPASSKALVRPVDPTVFNPLLAALRDVPPEQR